MNEATEKEPLSAVTPEASTANPVRAALALLTAQFPVIAEALPLGIGIDKAIFERVPDVPRKHIRTALRIHTASTRYLKAVVRCTQRVDLEGAPAGDVTDEQRTHAQTQLDERFAKVIEARKAQKKQARVQEVETRKTVEQEKKLNALVEKFGRK